MKQLSFLLLSIFLPITLLFAGIVPQKTAEKVAINLLSERLPVIQSENIGSVVVSSREIIEYQGEPLIYIFNIKNGNGFVLVSAEDRVYPILGYSNEGLFKTSNLPENIESWINDYKTQIIQVRELGIQADEQAVIQWRKYQSTSFKPEKSLAAVAPLLTTNWDQGCYYNAQCPAASGGDCNRAYVGCVATAMGQIMKYHNYPAQGTGSHSYTHPTFGSLSANFGATTYNWTLMPNHLTSNNSATATLLYHCGVSVNMNYGASGSGAYTTDALNALVNYFSYSSVALYGQKFWYTTTDWENLLKGDLDDHKPVLYSGQDPSFGHAFVCDGYQGTNYFHFNWGWSGWNNGYFYVSNLNSGNGTFNSNQAAIVHISPVEPPQAHFSASVTTICAETGVYFVDTSIGIPTTWDWQFPGGTPSTSNQQNPTIVYATPGLYNVTLTVSNSNGSNTISLPSYIKVKETPHALFPGDTTICFNHIIDLDAGNSGSTYLWSTGSTAQVITVDNSGISIGSKWFYVDITNIEGCLHRDSIYLTFANCYGIEELLNEQIEIFPNPSANLIRVNISSIFSGEIHFNIYSTGGQLIKSFTRQADKSFNYIFDLSDLQNGSYFMVVNSKEKVSRSRFLMLN